ncbi:MAG: excinuclease ABC subunit UvrA [Patescibacteria group bacterium]|nr:excinuclease ABC subunit UvrA [Patescibacteria group bacterium]
MTNYISLKGVRTNNLKNVSVDIPRNKVTVITGLSGSGKTSLAFDTIFAQAQLEYLESISTYSRKGFGKVRKPKAQSIEGLSPAIAIEQKKLGNNPRSTVGTYSEIYTYLRLLFSRISTPDRPRLSAGHFSPNNPKGACPKCRGIGFTFEVNIDNLIDLDKSINEGGILWKRLSPDSFGIKILRATNFFDFDKKIKDFSKKELNLLLYSEPVKAHVPEYVAKGFSYSTFRGMIKSIKRLKKRSDGRKMERDRNLLEYDKNLYIRKECASCKGLLLQKKVLAKEINGLNIAEVSSLDLEQLLRWLRKSDSPLAKQLIEHTIGNVQRLIDIGLGYLSLNRPIPTLSGGESQRLKLAKHLGINLIEMIYVLDEPTIGMHPKDIQRIIKLLKLLKANGNTVIVVEHDKEVIKSADFIIDIGPKAGKYGGKIVAQGGYQRIIAGSGLTSQYLSDKKRFKNSSRKRIVKSLLEFHNLKRNNLSHIDVKIAKNALNLVIGASGAGKSSLIEEIVEKAPEVVLIDQSPIGKTSRSNPATYTGLFDVIREEMALHLNCSKADLSFNSKGGCEKCGGQGIVKIDMHFLEDVEVVCDRCKGTRYKKDVLKNLIYKGKNIAEILGMSVSEISSIFTSESVLSKAKLLKDVGLGYLKIGQEATHLSGGESQRIKLGKHLDSKGDILILDEPTVGLHLYDIDRLMSVMHQIVDRGNTVIIVEHNVEVIRNADWIIELGPSGGTKGGKLLYQGDLNSIKNSSRSSMKNYLW